MNTANSDYFRKIAAMRKNPFHGFSDRELARQAQLKSVQKRKENAAKKATESQDKADSQETNTDSSN